MARTYEQVISSLIHLAMGAFMLNNSYAVLLPVDKAFRIKWVAAFLSW